MSLDDSMSNIVTDLGVKDNTPPISMQSQKLVTEHDQMAAQVSWMEHPCPELFNVADQKQVLSVKHALLLSYEIGLYTFLP